MKNLSKKFKIIFSICSVLVLTGTFFLGMLIGNGSLDKDVRELKDFLALYKAHYLFEDENAVEIMENSVLDDYSKYYTKEEYKQYLSSSNGSKYGVGFGVTSELVVRNVSFNSSSFFAGLKVGDKIVKVYKDGEYVNATYEILSNVVNNTKENTDMKILVERGLDQKEIIFQKTDYQQTFVNYQSLSGSYYFLGDNIEYTRRGDCEYLLKSNVGYIKYTNFSGTTDDNTCSYNQLVRALQSFKDEGKNSLILDLRNNGGGYMDILEKVASELVNVDSSKSLIHTVVYKDGREEKYYAKGNNYSNYSFNSIYVLVNENTASASEALIGAMLDYDKTGIVNILIEGHDTNNGRVYSTYGKGIMQATYYLANGDAVKLTVAKNYFPLSNICIHGVGITTALNEEYNNCISNVDNNLVEYANDRIV